VTQTNKPTAKLSPETKSICVFCGSRTGNAAHYMALATETGDAIAKSGYRLVYGGGGSGLMGATARAAAKAGGDVLGIIPEFLTEIEELLKDVPHEVVPDMHIRKRKMYDASDAFIVLPGGIGTMEEAVEIISWMRMRLHAKPIIFLSTDHYWQPLVDLMLHTIETGFSPAWMTSEILRANTVPASSPALSSSPKLSSEVLSTSSTAKSAPASSKTGTTISEFV